MRESCLECAVKHVGAALVKLSETLHGYQDHAILAYGELEEAVQETEAAMPEFSEFIRERRKLLITLVPKYMSDTEKHKNLQDAIINAETELRKRTWQELVLQFVEGGGDITPSENV